MSSTQSEHVSVPSSSRPSPIRRKSKPAAWVCVKVLDYQENFSIGYYITHDDISQKKKKKKNKASASAARLSPLATLKLSNESFIVWNGHFLYSIGGFENWGYEWSPSQNTSTVYAFDMRDSPAGRTQLPPMAAGRRSCAGLVHSQRLYVFGGIDVRRFPLVDDDTLTEVKMPDPADYPWAEVLDLEEQASGWKRLKEPPVRFPGYFGVFALLLNDSQILVGTLQGRCNPKDTAKVTFYIYNIETDQWTDSNYNYTPLACGKAPFLVDDDEDNDRCLYWLSGSTLRAYSLKTYEHYHGDLPFLSDYASKLWDGAVSHEPSLLHLGGREFCVFSVDESNESRQTSTNIWCFRFEANKSKGGKPWYDNLDISVSCSPTSYVIQKPVDFCDACLLDIGGKTIQERSSKSSWKKDLAVVNRKIKKCLGLKKLPHL